MSIAFLVSLLMALVAPANAEVPSPGDRGIPWVVAGDAELLGACAPLIAHRVREGFAVTVLTTTRRLDPTSSARRLRRRIHSLIRESNARGFLLLVGDPTHPEAPLLAPRRPGLGALGDDYADFAREIGSDGPFVDVDDDGAPEWACGRLPVRTVAETRRLVSKILRHEDHLRSSVGSGDAVGLIINEGGRGAVVDRLMASALDGVLRDALPARLRLRSLSGLQKRRDHVEAPAFGDAVIALLSRPGLATIYAGHGWTAALAPRAGHAVFGVADIARLPATGASAPFFAFACNIAGLAHPTSLGKAMVRSSRGPSAIFAASDPAITYGGIALGCEILRRLAPSAEPARLGEIVRQAKVALLVPPAKKGARQRLRDAARSFGLDVSPRALRHTVDVYLLYGDPALGLGPSPR